MKKPVTYFARHADVTDWKLALLVLMTTLVTIPNVEAAAGDSAPFDFGDFVALVIMVVIVFGGIFACLGSYARSRAGR